MSECASIEASKQASQASIEASNKPASKQVAPKARRISIQLHLCVVCVCVCVTECWHNVMFAGCLEVRCSCVVLNGAAELEHVCNGKS